MGHTVLICNQVTYRLQRIFVAIILMGVALFIPSCFAPVPFSSKSINLLSISSLLVTTYTLIINTDTKGHEPAGKHGGVRALNLDGSYHRLLACLNGALSLLVGVCATLSKTDGGSHAGSWLMCWLPAGRFQPT